MSVFENGNLVPVIRSFIFCEYFCCAFGAVFCFQMSFPPIFKFLDVLLFCLLVLPKNSRYTVADWRDKRPKNSSYPNSCSSVLFKV